MNYSSQENDQNEVSLFGLLQILKAKIRLVLGIPLCLFLAMLAYVFLVDPVWEATGVMQIGQVDQGVPGQTSLLVESGPRTVERMKLRSFENAVLNALKISLDDDDRDGTLFRNSLKLRLLPNTDLIEVKVRGHSPEEATRRAEAVVEQIRSVHERLAEPSVTRLKLLLDETKIQLKQAREEHTRLLKDFELKQAVGPGNRFSENVLFASILDRKMADIREFEQRKLALEEQLNPQRTYNTSLIDKVSVPEKPAFPKKALFVSLAAVLGLVVGAFVALTMHYWQAWRASN